MSKKRNTYLKLFLIALIVFLGVTLILFLQSQKVLREVTSTSGYIPMIIQVMVVDGETSSIMLKNECNELVFFISTQQAQSIQTGANKQVGFRPTTHDIFASVIERFGVDPLMVKITKLEQGTYFAELTFKEGLRYLTVDTRPSDAMAIAVRTNTPIYVNENLTTNVC